MIERRRRDFILDRSLFQNTPPKSLKLPIRCKNTTFRWGDQKNYTLFFLLSWTLFLGHPVQTIWRLIRQGDLVWISLLIGSAYRFSQKTIPFFFFNFLENFGHLVYKRFFSCWMLKPLFPGGQLNLTLMSLLRFKINLERISDLKPSSTSAHPPPSPEWKNIKEMLRKCTTSIGNAILNIFRTYKFFW